MSGEAAAAFLISHWGKLVVSALGTVAFWKYRKDDAAQEARFKGAEEEIKTLKEGKHQTDQEISLIKAENATLKDVLHAFIEQQQGISERNEERMSQINESINAINLNMVEVRTRLTSDVENIKEDISELKKKNKGDQ